MTALTINPAFQFIQATGVSGFVAGVQTGMILPTQALAGFNAVVIAIDTYGKTMSHDSSLTELRSLISGYPERQAEVFALLDKHSQEVDLAVRLAADAIGKAALFGAAAVEDLKEAPFVLGAAWRWIPPGEFQMGSKDDDPYASDDEKPLRTVITSGFYMLDHPVTNAEFLVFLAEVGREDMRYLGSKVAGYAQPTIMVDHEGATAYSKWLGEEVSECLKISIIGRLPTEAEWEKAAKGPSGNEFIIPATHEQAHFDAEATRVVNHPDVHKNGFGLVDMIGNVWEWTSSPWEEGSSEFVIRGGGSWRNSSPKDLRAAIRKCGRPNNLYNNVGFRPVLAPR